MKLCMKLLTLPLVLLCEWSLNLIEPNHRLRVGFSQYVAEAPSLAISEGAKRIHYATSSASGSRM